MSEPIITFLGTGSMNGSIMSGLLAGGTAPDRVRATTRSAASARKLKESLPEDQRDVTVYSGEDNESANLDAVKDADVVLLGVKPKGILDLAAEIKDALADDALVISVAAGIDLAMLEGELRAGQPVIRSMPNTPSRVGRGVIALAAGTHCTPEQLKLAHEVLANSGTVLDVEEGQINDTPEIRKGLLYSMAIAAAIHVVLLVLSALLSRPLKLDAVEQVNVIYSNAAALVIPLVKALMGDAYVIYSCAFIIVQLVLLWTHASSLLQGSSALDWKKVLTNINMIAIAAGALLYWFRVVLPAPLQNTMSTVGNMMGPMGMLLAGMAIAEKPLREVFCTRRNYLPTVLRLVVCPLVVLVLLWVCHASSWVADGKNILMTVYLAAITPACATVTSMAQLYDRDAAHSSALYVLTTLLSIVSMPVMIGLFDLLL